MNRIAYLFKRFEAFESASITSLVLSILVKLKKPCRYSQIVELENCRTYNFLKFYVRFFLKLLKVPH